jgi:hypothetical protein
VGLAQEFVDENCWRVSRAGRRRQAKFAPGLDQPIGALDALGARQVDTKVSMDVCR